MLREDKYFQTLSQQELWQRYCGYFDLSLHEFMKIQEELLVQEIDLVAGSTLGKKIMGGNKPRSVVEFRRLIPLTTYEDYEPYLSEHQEDALAIKPSAWCHSSGRAGKFKWFPYSSEAMDVVTRLYIAIDILATAERRGEIRIAPGLRAMISLAPRPYSSGTYAYKMSQVFTMRLMPPLEEGEQMSFRERMQTGFHMALKNGVDVIGSLSSVMVKVGETMAEEAQKTKFSPAMLHPRIVYTGIRAKLRSRLHKRPILPKDLWSPRGIITSGTDTSIYKDAVVYYWGKAPYEVYGSTETAALALQNWNKKWLTFTPYLCFWEFIPEEEQVKSSKDRRYQPGTVLYDELEEGKRYEVVLTHFYGMPLLRYRIGDIIKVVALKDDETGTNLPQVIFHNRIGETIDLAGLASLNERTVWQAIVNTGVRFEEWSARKEYDLNKSFLRLYIELKEEKDTAELEHLIHEQLKAVDVDYQDIDSWLEFQPVRVTPLSKGTFDRYYQEKVAEGADLAHLKPTHVNAPDQVIQRLLQLSQES